MQKFRVFFNKIVQQASGETGEVEIVRYQVGKMAKPVQANFLCNNGKVPNLCKAGRLKRVSISQWVKLNNFQFASEASKGQSPKPLPTKQAG